MKYTISDAVTGKVLAVVDHLQLDGDKANWEIVLAGAEKAKDIAGEEKIYFEVTEAIPSKNFPIIKTNQGGEFWISTHLGSLKVAVSRGVINASTQGNGKGKSQIKSSMPGKIIKVLCKPGDIVEAETPLLIIEAMKMENEIRSPRAGTVKEIKVEVGQKVESGELLLRLGEE